MSGYLMHVVIQPMLVFSVSQQPWWHSGECCSHPSVDSKGLCLANVYWKLSLSHQLNILSSFHLIPITIGLKMSSRGWQAIHMQATAGRTCMSSQALCLTNLILPCEALTVKLENYIQMTVLLLKWQHLEKKSIGDLILLKSSHLAEFPRCSFCC